MFSRRFLHCRRCGELHRVTPFDQAPLYQHNGAAISEVPTDDRRAFLDRHEDHPMEELTGLSEAKVRTGRFVEPMAVRYLAVSNGQALFVVRSSRRSIAEPLRYELLPEQQTLWKEESATLSPSMWLPFNCDTENEG